MSGKGQASGNLRGLAQATLFFSIAVWQTFPALIGMLLFILLVRILRMNWQYLIGLCGIMTLGTLVIMAFLHQFTGYISEGWQINMRWWYMGAYGHLGDAFRLSFGQGLFHLLSILPPMVGILALLELIPGSAHERQMHALRHGRNSGSGGGEARISSIDRALERLSDSAYDGTVLGVSRSSGKPVIMPDDDVNQMALVLGTTGGGKTVTLRRFYCRAMQANYPLIIIDGKPTAESTAWIATQAKAAGKPFYGFNCENHWHYDPLAHGGHTELKDKIISLKDEWENDYYRSIAEDYLQTTFEIGTRDMFDVTAQIGAEGSTGMGSVRRNKEFIIHPDAIKQDLQPGEAFYISKVGKFKSEKIQVKYS